MHVGDRESDIYELYCTRAGSRYRLPRAGADEQAGRAACRCCLTRSCSSRLWPNCNRAFYETMFKVKDFCAVPEYAELLHQFNQRVYPYVIGDQGTAKAALDLVAADWNAAFKKYARQ